MNQLTTHNHSLNELRVDFENSSNRAMSMPMAGTLIWTLVGMLSLFVDNTTAIFILLFGTGGIFPIAMGIAKLRNENLISAINPLAKLMGLCVLMVNLLWALHIPILLTTPNLVPVSVGIALGLHWIVYSWIIQHPLGLVHSILRTAGIVIVWFLFPNHSVLAVSSVVVLAYLVTLYQMQTRDIPGG